jgi:secreted Zn-dependent insulinase-like peptidase
VFAIVKMLTNDLSFPHNKASVAFTWLWDVLLEEHLRELTYEGALAGMSFGLTVTGEDIACSLASYNQSYDAFFAEAFNEIRSFEPKLEVFRSKQEQLIRSLKN